MRLALATNWWALVIRGLAAVLLGVLALAWPGITLLALVFLFAGYALVDGVTSLVGAARAIEHRDRWGVLIVEGIVGIAAAVVSVAWPGITAIALVYVIAAWAIITAILEIAAAIRLRRVITHEWLLILAGIASLVFGFLLMIAPLGGTLVIAIWVGVYALVFGVMLIALGFRLRPWDKTSPAGGQVPLPAH